jgi:hypothetical protein
MGKFYQKFNSSIHNKVDIPNFVIGKIVFGATSPLCIRCKSSGEDYLWRKRAGKSIHWLLVKVVFV